MTPSPIKASSLLTTSQNVVVRQGLTALQKYNLLLPTMLNLKRINKNYMLDVNAVSTMDSAYFSFVTYILHKSPAVRKERGRQKWQDAVAICKQFDQHAAFFGIQFLQGEFSTNPDHNYWLERFKPDEASSEAAETFSWWVTRNTRQKLPFSPKRGGCEIAALEYMDAMRRQEFETTFSNGTATVNGKTLHTASSQGAYTGFANTYIYVCSAKTRKIYTGPCEEGVLHHSSFLQGEPVVCAGDWIVAEGKPCYINTGSGHYRPTSYNMEMFGKMFESAWGAEMMVQPTYKGRVMYMKDYLRSGVTAKSVPRDQLERLAATVEVSIEELTKHAE